MQEIASNMDNVNSISRTVTIVALGNAAVNAVHKVKCGFFPCLIA